MNTRAKDNVNTKTLNGQNSKKHFSFFHLDRSRVQNFKSIDYLSWSNSPLNQSENREQNVFSFSIFSCIRIYTCFFSFLQILSFIISSISSNLLSSFISIISTILYSLLSLDYYSHLILFFSFSIQYLNIWNIFFNSFDFRFTVSIWIIKVDTKSSSTLKHKTKSILSKKCWNYKILVLSTLLSFYRMKE